MATTERSWDLMGRPGISVPAGLTATGLPSGAQFLADHGQEDLLLAPAHRLESS